MKKLRLLLSLLFCFTASLALAKAPKLVLISDVDDTIKASDVRDSLERISYSVFNDSLFYGMNLTYQALNKDGSQFFYLSNGWRPTVVESHQAILNDFNFPQGENYIPRNLGEIISKVPHKKNRIAEIVKSTSPEIIVFVGDNGEKDPQIYHEMKAKIENDYHLQGKKVRILTYIHTVYKPDAHSQLFPEQVAFSNAAELAVLLNEEKLLSFEQTMKIVLNMLYKVKKEKANSVYGPLVYPFFKYRGRLASFNHQQCLRSYMGSPFTHYLNLLNPN